MEEQTVTNPDEEPLDKIGEEYRRLDVHIQLLLQENHPRIMNLEQPIPENYPWQKFLERHFAHPPFRLNRDDYEIVIVGKSKHLQIHESRRPATYYSILRFLEFFRSRLVHLERDLQIIEDKHEKLRSAAREKVGIKALLRAREWGYETISNKHEIMEEALQERSRIESFAKRLGSMLEQNHNITSRWQYMIEPFYRMVTKQINESIAKEGSYNLRLFYPVKSLEKKISPYYYESMNMAIDLNEAVIQTSAFLKNKPP